MNHAINFWLNEEEVPQQIPQGMDMQGQTPPMGPGQQPQAPQADPNAPPEQPEQQDQNTDEEVPDVSQDPQSPDMPEDSETKDFENWKREYFKQNLQSDVTKLLDMIHQVRDTELDSYPRKFVEDNLQILFLRQNSNIDKASLEVKKLIKQELDRNNPSVSIIGHLFGVLSEMAELSKVFIKIKGTLGMKPDLHRKYIASLLSCVQVGSGGLNEDLILNDKNYSIKISTRFNDQWGKVEIGKWNLTEDDPERYLSDPELKRLEEGSPEEKEVLRKRIVIESISEGFKFRSFIVNVVGKDGTVYFLGFDPNSALKAAYADGKLVIETDKSQNSEAMIDDDGNIVPFIDLKVKLTKETGELDQTGKPILEKLDFMERINGILFLTAQLSTIKDAMSSFQGIVLKEIPYNGNPNELLDIQRCIPSVPEILLRNC
jgi:hypothetical protein